MTKTDEIITQDGHHFYIKKDFLKICPRPQDYFAYDLINEFNLLRYIISYNEVFTNKLEDLINE